MEVIHVTNGGAARDWRPRKQATQKSLLEGVRRRHDDAFRQHFC